MLLSLLVSLARGSNINASTGVNERYFSTFQQKTSLACSTSNSRNILFSFSLSTLKISPRKGFPKCSKNNIFTSWFGLFVFIHSTQSRRTRRLKLCVLCCCIYKLYTIFEWRNWNGENIHKNLFMTTASFPSFEKKSTSVPLESQELQLRGEHEYEGAKMLMYISLVI